MFTFRLLAPPPPGMCVVGIEKTDIPRINAKILKG